MEERLASSNRPVPQQFGTVDHHLARCAQEDARALTAILPYGRWRYLHDELALIGTIEKTVECLRRVFQTLHQIHAVLEPSFQ